LNLYYMT